MDFKGDEIAQDILLFQKSGLKLTCDNLDSCTKNPMASLVVLKTERKCHFCKIKENNKLKYGPLYSLSQIVAHYYCVLLSTRMKQNGKDDEGIMGFLLRDINLELRRSKKVSCAYCQEKNATVKCAHQGCKKVFHYPCGLESGALSRFRNDFISFCYQHRPKQKIPKKILEEAQNTELLCAICYETVDSQDRIDSLWAPCCLKTWYHRNCVQKLAQSSGYFFRCATCNDNEKFKKHMEDNGIFVPQQDASWELVPNAYEELLVRHSRCDALRCKCPKGREENVENTRWEVILCRFCGSQGIHVGCGNLKFTNPQWECETCQSIMKADSKSKSKSKPKSNTKKVEEDYKSDLPVKRPASKSGDQPATRKRKLSGQQGTMDKRKRGGGSSDDDNQGCTGGSGSSDEFYIRIPGRKSDKPHTITKPEETENENHNHNINGNGNENGNENVNENKNENETKNKNENENENEEEDEDEDEDDEDEDEDEDEDVDVITYDAAWLMVEEVLSRVKPAPLSYKIKLIRKKCFAYHFDPFDVREERPETVDLASDTENNCPATQATEEADSDIEIIEEFLVNKKPEAKKATKGSPVMEVDDTVTEPSNVPDVARQPEPSESKEEEMEECTRPPAPREIQVYDISDDDEPAREMSEIFSHYEGLGDYPSTSRFGMDFENSIMPNPDEMSIPMDDEEDKNLFDDDVAFEYETSPFQEDIGAEADRSEDSSDDEELTQRRIGTKQRGSKLSYHYKIKRRRIAASYPNPQQHITLQHSIASSNSASTSQVLPSGESSFNPAYPEEPMYESNVLDYEITNTQTNSRVVVNNTPGGFSTGGDPLYTAPITSTTVTSGFQTFEMAASRPSRSQESTSLPTTSWIHTSGQSTNSVAQPSTSTSWMHPAAIATPGPSTPSVHLSGTPSSRVCTPPMRTFASDSCCSGSEGPTSPATKPDSRSATPLPTIQFLTTLKPAISPLLSQSSNSSCSLAPAAGNRLFQHLDISSSSESSNDGFPEDDEKKPSPPP